MLDGLLTFLQSSCNPDHNGTQHGNPKSARLEMESCLLRLKARLTDVEDEMGALRGAGRDTRNTLHSYNDDIHQIVGELRVRGCRGDANNQTSIDHLNDRVAEQRDHDRRMSRRLDGIDIRGKEVETKMNVSIFTGRPKVRAD
jgi:hypothetical protein